MQIRTNTKKLLFWLYSDEKTGSLFKTENIRLLFDQLSDDGWRSMLFLLQKKGLVELRASVGEGKSSYIRITSLGKRVIESEMAVLDRNWPSWDGERWAVLMIRGEKGEKQRGELTKLIKRKKLITIPIGCGGWLMPEFEADKLLLYMDQEYLNFFWLWKIERWEVGDWSSLIFEHGEIEFYMNFYSRVSSEAKLLLNKMNGKKSRSDRDKTRFVDLFNKVFITASLDPGWSSGCWGERRQNWAKRADCKVVLDLFQSLLWQICSI